ncbi:AraC family transcriptional regulator [uncultured Kriegella sp.]|uniref:helix-turn-helix domain-containing protein n=1 Tax=uncultured Kriegella sp. TaxID=1798910 RepID=UPI0030DD24BC|tara:strand:+ start:11297 stop:12745 length:1449 start_codon:yes stop_codon:yes gene_type:complete
MLRRLGFFITLFLASCSSPERPNIVFEDFESGNFDNWNKLGVAFNKPTQLDSVSENIYNTQGKFFAFSNFEGEGLSYNQGKLVSKPFIINRKYIHFLMGGGNHDTRECVNLIIGNKVVRTIAGMNDYTLRKITWDVADLEGEEAVIEVVDAIATDFEYSSIASIIVDHFVFSDFRYPVVEIFEDFESGSYANWKVEGEAFEIPRNRTNVYYPITANGFNGKFFAFSFGETHDTKQGKLTSKLFKIKYDGIKFLVGGGAHKDKTCINLVINDSVVYSQVGQDDGQMRWHQWDVSQFKGKNARIEIVDHYSGGWGHIMVDDIIFYNKPVNFNIWLYLIFALFVLTLSYFFSRKTIFRKKIVPKAEISDEEMEKFKRLKKSIENSNIYKEHNPAVGQIVQISGINEDDINLLFEKAEGTTLTNYINYLRVQEFKRQLKDPENEVYTMMYLAEKSGFSSKTSFYRVFKSITKRTPSEYKKSLDKKH